MPSSSSQLDPLGPITYAVKVLTVLVTLALTVVGAATITGSGSIGAFGRDTGACISLRDGVLPTSHSGNPLTHGAFGARPHVVGNLASLTVCDYKPGIGTRAFASLPDMSGLLFFIGFLAMAILVLRRARTHGLFSSDVAGSVTAMGAYLLGGSLLTAAISIGARAAFLHEIMRRGGWPLEIGSFPWLALVAGCGVLTFGRVMHIAVRMQEDIDATI